MVDRFDIDIDIDNVSIFKGLINRIIRQDQWDWFTVYTMFGEPDPASLVRIPQYLTDLRKFILSKNITLYENTIDILLEYRIDKLCEYYLGIKKQSWNNDDLAGYLYILSRRDSPDILKIGMTTRNVGLRVKEINSATGVLIPYSVRRIYKVNDARNAEEDVFVTLDEYRIRNDREFFNIDFRSADRLIRELLHKKNYNIKQPKK